MKVQTTPNPAQTRNLSQPQGPQEPKEPKNPYAAYDEVDTDKHRISYEAAYNLSRGLAYAVEGGARIGQTMQLGSALLGQQAGSLAGPVGLIGGTIDVARGASLAQQAAINRNRDGAVLGGLQIVQGLATWVSAGAAFAGAPVAVSQVAAVAAVGALAGRIGYQQVAKGHKKSDDKSPPGPKPEVSVKYDESKAKPKGDGRLLENTFALAKSVSEAASNMGGMAAGWNNLAGLWSGSSPTGLWQGLGIVGSTYSILQGAATVAHAAGNQHLDDTLAGTLGVIQGGASLAVSMGVGGHLLPGVAVGSWVLKQALPLLQLKKRLSSSDDDNGGMMERLKENIGYVFSGKPEGPGGIDDIKEIRSPEPPAKEDPTSDKQPKAEEPKSDKEGTP